MPKCDVICPSFLQRCTARNTHTAADCCGLHQPACCDRSSKTSAYRHIESWSVKYLGEYICMGFVQRRAPITYHWLAANCLTVEPQIAASRGRRGQHFLYGRSVSSSYHCTMRPSVPPPSLNSDSTFHVSWKVRSTKTCRFSRPQQN